MTATVFQPKPSMQHRLESQNLVGSEHYNFLQISSNCLKCTHFRVCASGSFPAVLLPRLLSILFVAHGLIPFNLSMTNSLMHHISSLISSMPTRCSSRAPYHIPRHNPFRLPTLITYPSLPRSNPQKLTSRVIMPVCSSTWRKVDIGNAEVLGAENWFDEYFTTKDTHRFAGNGVFLARATDNTFGHFEC